MKLRIRGNSIRLRLTKSDIAQFAASGKVEEIVEFGFAKPTLSYRLDKTEDVATVSASFKYNCLKISIPIADADEWIESESVGIESAQPIGDNNVLRILIEKDFACLEKRAGEDDSDTFKNPLAESKTEKC
ncbi:MAG: hypothetical protein H7070_02325 [Saprospiraceae bacterium]|nr:hypothetical protein [Pyrinomonadaceae bacterium]